VRTSTRSLTWETARPIFIIAAIAALVLSALFGIRPATTAAFTAGENGHPNGGPYSDLKGGTASFTFEQNGQLTCDGDDNAKSFTFTVDYDITGTLPAGATLVIYLSPNNGAISGNSGGNDAAYIAAVESNWGSKDLSGWSGSGSFTFNLSVSSSFQLSSGGVLGVFARENPLGQEWNSKTNSLNCTEAPQSQPASVPESQPASVPESQPASVPESQPASVPESQPASVEQSVAGSQEQSVAQSNSPEGSQLGGTGTPSGSVPNGSVGQNGVNPLPTVLFSLILLASLAGLAFANVKTARSRS